jgi:serine/threonine-protein kinase RsbW
LQTQSFFIRKIHASIKNLRNTVNDILSYYEDVFGDISESSYTELKVILNELLINAIKHGSKEDEGKCISVIADLTADKYALLVVEDEGDGYDTSFIEGDNFSDYGDPGAADGAEAGASYAGGLGESRGGADGPAQGELLGDEAKSAMIEALLGIEETGRGIQIVRNLSDDFMLNSKGNKVVVKKRLRKY